MPCVHPNLTAARRRRRIRPAPLLVASASLLAVALAPWVRPPTGAEQLHIAASSRSATVGPAALQPAGKPAAAGAGSAASSPAATGAEAVSIASGETPATIVAHWAAQPGDGPASVALYDASATVPQASAPLVSIPAAPGIAGVALPRLDPARAYVAVVTVSGAGGARRVGPSPAFSAGATGPVFASPAPAPAAPAPSPLSHAAAGSSATRIPPTTAPPTKTPFHPDSAGGVVGTKGSGSPPAPARTPGSPSASVSARSAAGPSCLGAGFGVGAVSVDGYSGVQGSYCTPPLFGAGTGTFCVDHGLDYPSGSYRWASGTVGEANPLVNQYDAAANPADVARLAWIVATQGATADPARSVAIGIIAHAVMGDYPGLTTADLDPPAMTIEGGDPAASSADVAAMWSASGSIGAPYQVVVTAQPGPYLAGQSYRGSVQVLGRGGGAESGVPLDFSASQQVSVIADPPASTGPGGTLGFTFTPAAASFDLVATASVLLPGDTLTLWSPQQPPVAVQRVVTAGAGLRPTGSLQLSAQVPARATLVKVSTDPVGLPAGSGFGFDVAVAAAGGTWQVIAHRDTAADGSSDPIDDLAAGAYRVVETAHPPAFEGGGPWYFTLAAGQQATWQLADAPVPRHLVVVKVGDDESDVPVGAGASFAVSFDSAGDGRFATPVGQLTTGPDARTGQLAVVPGRYRIAETTPPAGYLPAAPVEITVAPVASDGGKGETLKISDHAIPATLLLEKTDAATGLGLAGAVLRVVRVGAGRSQPVGEWTTTSSATRVAGLVPGRYRVSEVRAPSGYVPSAVVQTVALQPGQTLQVTIEDAAVTTPTTGGPTRPASIITPASIATAAATSMAAPSALAFTGLPLWRLLLAAAGATGVGSSLVLVARTRRRFP